MSRHQILLGAEQTPGPEGLAALLAESGYSKRPAFHLACEDTAFDTFDGRLHKSGYRLIHRSGENRWRLERGSTTVLETLGSPVSSAGIAAVKQVDKKLLKNRRLIPFLITAREERLFLPATHEDTPRPTVRWVTLTFRDPHGAESSKVVQILDVDGDPPSTLARLIATYVDEPVLPDFDEYENGLRLLGIPRPGEAPPESYSVVSADPVPVVAAKILGAQAFVLRTRRRGAVLDLDVEYVHQMRVAARRSRAALKAFSLHLDPTRRRALDRELRWLGTALGRLRDLDVMTHALPLNLKQLPRPSGQALRLLDAFRRRRHAAQEAAAHDLESERFSRLVHLMETAHLEREGINAPTLAEEAPLLMERALTRALKWNEQPVSTLKDADLHRIRIAFKKLRYIGEIVAPIQSADFSKAVSKLVAFQDHLGDFNDTRVARSTLREMARAVCTGARPDADLLLLVGALVHGEDVKAKRERTAFAEIWKRFPAESRKLTARLRPKEEPS